MSHIAVDKSRDEVDERETMSIALRRKAKRGVDEEAPGTGMGRVMNEEKERKRCCPLMTTYCLCR